MDNSVSAIKKTSYNKMTFDSIPSYSKYNERSSVSDHIENVPSDDCTRKSTAHDNKTLDNSTSNLMFCKTSNSTDRSSPFKNNKIIIRSDSRERTRDLYFVPQRMKIRSLKRRTTTSGGKGKLKRHIGVDSIDWGREMLTDTSERRAVDDGASDHSSDGMCRICHGSESSSVDYGTLVSACRCRGTVGKTHVRCLERWLTESGKSRCELCACAYATRRFHRYGVLRAVLMWLLSQNTKQLLVDMFGITLMSPLAALAAWLTAHTLSRLVTPEEAAAPWPLASTFVLACMTLVCYYCWVVSAAARHVLAWWVWYRSQYEVRLRLPDCDC